MRFPEEARQGQRRVEEILLGEGKITPEQLQHALEVKQGDGRNVGEILSSMGYVSSQDLAQALAERHRVPYMELGEKDVDPGVLGLVDQKTLRRHTVMPVRVDEGGRLVVAMGDPSNIPAIEDLRMISGYTVSPMVALEAEIRQVQNRLLSLGDEVSEMLQGVEEEEESGELEIGGESEEVPVVKLVGSIIQRAVGEGASDIHMEPRSGELAVRFRVDGVLREIMSVPQRLQRGVIARLKIMGNLDIAEHRLPQDGRFTVRVRDQKVDFRVASLPASFGEKVVLRILDTSSVEVGLEDLGFSSGVLEGYREIFNQPYGAVLVTGPTGSGKSTTLYATLKELHSPEKNIITVEDPVEFRISGINQMQVNPKIGLTFASALRSILRNDPDVIMIGEIRDYETAKISVESALTGHMVLATLHTNDAPSALTRLTEMGVEPFLTSSAVDCVIAQRLARRLCLRCRQPEEVDGEVLEDLGFPFHLFDGNPGFYRAVGCDRCGGTGYRGRIGLYEMMVVDEEIREKVVHRSSASEVARAAEKGAMIRLREDGLLKTARGITSIEEVLRTVI